MTRTYTLAAAALAVCSPWAVGALLAQEPAPAVPRSQPTQTQPTQTRTAQPEGEVLAGPGGLAPLRFAGGADPIPGWTFESVGYKPNVGNGRVVTIGPEGAAAIHAPGQGSGRDAGHGDNPEAGEGVVMVGAKDTARGDLVSQPFQLPTYRWVEVQVTYEVLTGEPMVFVGLRPTEDRRIVDVAFLPPGKQRATVRIHSSNHTGPYSLSLSIGGTGTVRWDSVQAEAAGDYRTPERPICMLDIRSADPDLGPSPNFERVADLFGFPRVESMHYLEFDPVALKEMDPAFLVLPGLWSSKGVDEKVMDAAVRRAAAMGYPIVGTCLGHQVLARAHGATLRRGTKEWGPTEIQVRARDPLFRGLPRRSRFVNSESHRYEVVRPLGRMQVIASSEGCTNQVFRYRGRPWYTFQGHIERGWDVCSPEALVLWKNMFRIWRVIPDP